MKRLPGALSALLVGVTGLACSGEFDGTPRPTEGQRLVTGRLVPPTQTELSFQPVALQLAAVSIDAREDPPISALAVSPAFSPGANGGQPVTFRLALPTDRAWVLFFQAPTGAQQGLGQLVGRLRFPSGAGAGLTDLLSGRAVGVTAPLSDLDLGTVKIDAGDTSNPAEGASPLADNVVLLGDGEAINPLSLNDTDGDGTPDLDDADDDNDRAPDDGDPDANGDGIPDDQQIYDALRFLDLDGDQIPDIFQP